MVSDVLNQPRDISFGDRVQQVRDYDYLVGCIDVEIEVIQRAEAELDTNPGEAPQIWAYIATHAACLEALLGAQEQWLADDDAALAAEADTVRTLIRNLAGSSYKGGEEDGI